ncbi:MAG TPA: vitamin B12 dependent-methionine synthase activation domain-containing protein, partial [Hyphomicrobiales bacterium]|nr:vitamin B12 dependent-methionine synthase activation domain-containing protein [Hyphomicrobiales bacterium]
SLDKARANAFDGNWDDYHPPEPTFAGVRSFDVALDELIEFIDWTPFFQAWELSGRYPDILGDDIVGKQARELFDDAQAMLKKIIDEKWLQARAVVGFWPARREGDDVALEMEVGNPATLHFLRQQADKPAERPNLCLADFIAPKDGGSDDWIGAFAVTAGLGIEAHVKRFEENHDDYSAILLKALADRLAEACAEYMHQCVRRKLWGYAADEDLDNNALIAEKYRGIRPAPGYPACPDHTEKITLFKLLDAEENAGIELTEGMAMFPAASVSGWYFSHPQSQYFVVGRLSRDQVADYAKRKRWSLAEAERWLAPNLDYDPD